MQQNHNFDINACLPHILKDTGSHYTPIELSDFISAHILLNYDLSGKKNLKILDPAIGNGDLVVSLLRQLKKKFKGEIELYGFDTNQNAIRHTKELMRDEFSDVKCFLKCDDFLTAVNEINGKIDIVISNPPYIRTQVMGAEKAQSLAKEYKLDGRVDLYYAFFPAIHIALKEDGILGIITSNRFMSTKSGESVRESIATNYKIYEIWDFGDTKLFEAAVLPCVMIMSPGKTESNQDIAFSSSYSSSTDHEPSIKIKKLINLFETPGPVTFNSQTFLITSGSLEITENLRDVWKISNKKSKDFLSNVKKNTELTFKDIGKIRVGVKTTSDSVFIRKNEEWLADQVENEFLKDLTTHHIARRWYPETKKRNKKILYTHFINNDKKLEAINFSKFPKTKKYLEANREKLESRTYVIEAGRKWYEIWVPQNPAAWPKAKIVFRDIAEKPTFWFDDEGTVINGDCYWFTNDNQHDEAILWLALAVANSSFILKFYEYKFNNKLYSGRCRFMTQYVNEFPIPKLSNTISKEIIKLSKKAYELSKFDKDTAEIEAKIDVLVHKVFQVE